MRKCLLLIISIIVLFGCQKKVKQAVETANVKKGEFFIEVVETGEIESTKSQTIASPPMSWRFGQLKINKIIDDGTEISTGDTVMLFDPSEVQKAIIDANAELEIAKAELEKLKAEQESKIGGLEADLKISTISHEISQIELDQAVYESENKKKEIQLNLDKAKISLDKAEDEIENQKKINVEEVQQLRLKIRQLENNLEEANQTLNNLTVISAGSGIAIIRKNWQTGNKWQVGDQTWSGNPMIDLPDLSELKVTTEINEVDISKIKMDQGVEIRMDAFSDTMLTGKVNSIATLAKFKDGKEESKVKVFPVEVLINGTSKKLMPGMTVSTKIIVDKVPDVLYIPLEAIMKDQGKEFVYLKSGATFKKCPVSVGMANNDYIIVQEGLAEGDEVALSDPFKTTEQKEG